MTDRDEPTARTGSTPEHYFSRAYLSPERFFSYGLQLELLRSLEPRSVLEVGPGPGIVSYALRRAGLPTVTLDTEVSLAPTLVADVTALPLAAGSVDAVLCAQVLEHLSFERACEALCELRRVARSGAVVSVPDIRPYYRVELILPKIRWEARVPVPWRRPPLPEFDGHHHWVIGARGYPPERFRRAARQAGFAVAQEARPAEHSYHHFFLLR